MPFRSSTLLLSTFLLFTSSFVSGQTGEEITRADSLRGMLTPLRTCYEVNFYHLDIKVDINQKFISGSNLFRFTATEDFSKLQIDLFDNYDIEKIVYKGTELNYTFDYDAIFIEFPETIKKGSKSEFTVYYSGVPIMAKNPPWDGGFIFTEDKANKPWVAVACQGLGASSWWPTKDHQSDEPDSMQISVTVPQGLQGISNGRLRSVEELPGGWSRFNWFVSYPINNYNVTLNIGDFAHFSDMFNGEKGKLSLDYYVLPQNLEKAKKHFQVVKPMLKCFEHWFGPYPFYRDGYKLIEAPYLGMEHQSAIAYGNNYKQGYSGTDLSKTGLGLTWDYLIVHESGHEWFGNNITAKDIADMWIHEAFTTYSEGLFVECREGKTAGARYIAGERGAVRNDKPVIGLYGLNKEGSQDMYFKGTNMLHTIRSIINNDALWRSILRGLNKEFALKTVAGEEIISYINDKSGKDLSKVFEQYLKHTSIPTLLVTKTGTNRARFKWKSAVEGFDMPVRIRSGNNKWMFIYPTTQPKTIKVESFSDLEVDTRNFYIQVDINRADSHKPAASP